jgi:hypothetical protein
MSRIASLRTTLVLLICLIAAGCSQKITITQYPEFYSEDLKTVAVVPFRNTTNIKTAGDTIAEQFARSLAGTQTYQVFSRYDLKTVLDEQDLRLALGGDATEAAKAMGKSGKVQALITGAVTAYSWSTRNEPKRDPVYSYDNKGNQYISGYRDWVQTHNEATVAVTAAMLKVSDGSGSTIHATPNPAQATISSDSTSYGPPNMDPNACLTVATRNVVNQLVEEFAVVRKVISVSPAKAFRTASDFYDNKYNYTNNFSSNDAKMLVCVNLPACCDRNRFRITVVKDGSREELANIELVWQRQWSAGPGTHFELSPKEIAGKAGPGTYLVKFYSGPEPVLTQKIQIK